MAAVAVVMISAAVIAGLSRNLFEPRPPEKAAAAQVNTLSMLGPAATRDATVQSLFVDVTFEADTPERPALPPSWHEGIQMLGALETDDGTRIRLATDWRYQDHQQTTQARRVSFRFAPESADDLHGRSVHDLASFNKMQLDLKRAFAHLNFAQESREVAVTVRIVVNGVHVVDSHSRLAPAQLLTDDAPTFHLDEAVGDIPKRYYTVAQ
ncbi:MAG TPA: hypothetical protein VEK11_17750 [Thermoanaerobaculia bacterium]|nr:hypothetical protein [Thermoanaerobaculia bacterium]